MAVTFHTNGLVTGNTVKSPGNVIQVVTASTSTSVTTSAGSLVDSGLSASITPFANSSKILVMIDSLK